MDNSFILKNSSVRVALIGNPNSGKSTLFNAFTGLNQKTGNFPGVTVEKRTGEMKVFSRQLNKEITAEIIDLPGAYSIKPTSLDEKIASAILTENNPDSPDIIIYIADATNLKRSLFLATQVIELGKPVIFALNMMDVAQQKGISIDVVLLEKNLGVKVVPISARKNSGIDKIREAITGELPVRKEKFIAKENLSESLATIERYRVITFILNKCQTSSAIQKDSFTNKLDKILTHKIWGFVIFLGILFLIFESIFFISAYPMNWIETLFSSLSHWSDKVLPEGELADLFVNGILAGLSGVIVFIPQIAMLFFFIAILEDSGYMARVSFIMDKLMRKFGLNGKSVIPLIGGFACAVPAIMSARTISNWKERLITVMVTPLMSCSARLPVYTLLISLVVPSETYFGIFNIQGIVLMSLYLFGFLAAIGSAVVMKYIIRAKEKSYFIMEMPEYRSPRWSNVGYTIWEKVKVFCIDAGKVIIAISVILWFLASHAPGNSFEEIEKKYSSAVPGDSESKKTAEKLEASYAGFLGKKIEPLISPLGFNWKIGIALVTSFAAREVFVGTMATIYSAGDENNPQSIREKMFAERNPLTGEKIYSVAVGFSLMIFYAFALQCMSTIAVVYRETKSWKWPAIQFLYMGALAYFASWLVFNFFK